MLVNKIAYKYLLRTSIPMRASQFEQLPAPTGRVVFFGDSITEGGLWQEWFPEVDTVNRGISGETIANLLTRLNTAIDAPAAVFLLVGTNDIGMGATVDRVASDMRQLVAAVRERAQQAPVFVQSVMPRQTRFARRIRELNSACRDIAADHGATCIDLWPALADETGGLRPEFTRDRLHLNGAGYAAWVDVLRPFIAAL
ncbi:GDSL-type esterase/lipase family protein [Nocardia fluminea]|uniref:GDSL-type esterase/lipase family protein n=1 Tax=Nocardia fluminea TaxID=134984 RepID=UPI00340A99F4